MGILLQVNICLVEVPFGRIILSIVNNRKGRGPDV